MHLISEIPDPAAYGARLLTSRADVKANRTFHTLAFTFMSQPTDTFTANNA
jgi:hypothetical protein